jgi:hypothetical protein
MRTHYYYFWFCLVLTLYSFSELLHIFCACLSVLCVIVPQINAITEVYLFEIRSAVAVKFACCFPGCKAVLSGSYQCFRGAHCFCLQGKDGGNALLPATSKYLPTHPQRE